MLAGPKLRSHEVPVYDQAFYQHLELLSKRRADYNTPRGLARARMEAHQVAFEAVLNIPMAQAMASSKVKDNIQILDKPTFKLSPLPPLRNIFASVVKGENASSFNQLEMLVNIMRQNAVTDHILLVGPPSAGKTLSAKLVADGIERPFLPLSGEKLGTDLQGVVEGPLSQLFNNQPYSEAYKHPKNGMLVRRIKPLTIFVDEVHAMPSGIQTSMLIATEDDRMLPLEKGGYMDFQDVLFIFGTTEPQMLNKPLRTRFTTVTMVHYSVESIAEMIRRKFPQISQDDAIYLSRCSKLYPREAVRFARQVVDSGLTPRQFGATFLGADERGLDATDRKLLGALESKKKHKNPQKVQEARLILEQREKFTPLQVIRAEVLLNTEEFHPMFLTALADKLMLTSAEEIRVRVNYLESLGLVLRTPRGVIRQVCNESEAGARS